MGRHVASFLAVAINSKHYGYTGLASLACGWVNAKQKMYQLAISKCTNFLMWKVAKSLLILEISRKCQKLREIAGKRINCGNRKVAENGRRCDRDTATILCPCSCSCTEIRQRSNLFFEYRVAHTLLFCKTPNPFATVIKFKDTFILPMCLIFLS